MIGESWKTCPLKRACAINKATLGEDTPDDWEMQYLDISAVDSGGNINALQSYNFANAPSRARRLVRPGETVISTVRTYLKAIAYFKEPPENLVASTGFAVLSPGPDVDPRFLWRAVQEHSFVERVVAHSEGVGYPAIAPSRLASLRISFPERTQQRRIAAYLDEQTAKIDRLMDLRRRQMELLKEQRAAIIQQAVTRGLDPDAPMKDSGLPWLGEIPAHWEVKRLGSFASVKARLGWKGLKAEEYVDEGYIFLATPNLKNTDIDYENVNYITQERYLESPEIMLREQDVLLVKDGATLGIVALVKHLPAPATVNSSIAVIRPVRKCCSAFLCHWLRSTRMQQFIDMVKGGMGVPHLFQSDIRRFYVPIPPKEEQQKICEFIEEQILWNDALHSAYSRQLDLLAEYRASLIHECVTGQRRVGEEITLEAL